LIAPEPDGRRHHAVAVGLLLLVVTAQLIAGPGYSDSHEIQGKGAGEKPCSDCHADWEPPEIVLAAPYEVTVNASFALYATILNHGEPVFERDKFDDGYPYEAQQNRLELLMEQAPLLTLDSSGTQSVELLEAGTRGAALWSLLAGGDAGEQTLVVQHSTEVYYQHNTPQKNRYRLTSNTVAASLMVRDTPLRVSSPLLLATPGLVTIHQLTLWSAGDTLYNVTIDTSSIEGVEVIQPPGTGDRFTISADEAVTVQLNLTLASNYMSNYTTLLPLRWETGEGEEQVFNLTLASTPAARPVPGQLPPRFLGRTMGLVMLGMLLVTSILGGPMARRRWLNRQFRRAGLGPHHRIAVHKYLSLTILAMGLLHGVVLVLGPFSGLGWECWGVRLWLGWLLVLVFAALAALGLYQRQYMRWRSFHEWRLLHRTLAVAGLLGTLIHGLLVGTDIGFLR